MSYKVTIIDNDNGEVLVDIENAVAIVGAITNGEDGSVREIGFLNCDDIELGCTTYYAEMLIAKIKADSPEIKPIMKRCKKLFKKDNKMGG